jgi:hypothetical protein
MHRRAWKGVLRAIHGVKKRNIFQKDVPKVRHIVFRWAEEAAEAAAKQ